jgi:hypothetical protein
MRAVIFSAALLAGTAFLALAPAASAQQYGGYPGGYGPYGLPTYGAPYGGSYPNGYGGGYIAASPYAGVCAALAYAGATQGYAAVAMSPYAQTCAYLGLMGGSPGFGYAALSGWGALGPYGTSGLYGPSSYPYTGSGSYYGVSGLGYGPGYASYPTVAGTYGSYGGFWPYSIQ